MREVFKTTTKIKFGGGLNLLCIAAAGYLWVKTAIEFNRELNRKKDRKHLEEACQAVEKINEIVDKIQVKTTSANNEKETSEE